MISVFLPQLSRLVAEFPTRAKWVFVPSHAIGRTLGDRLALEGTDWANLRFVTPLDVALRMGAPFLVERGVDPSEEGLGPALMMRLLWSLPPDTSYFRPLADQPQMAAALWSTVRELRMAGLRSSDLTAGAFAAPDKHSELCGLMQAYEAYLAGTSRGDRAMVFEEALKHADWCPIQPQDCWTEMPGVIWSPLERRLIDGLPGDCIAPDVGMVAGFPLPRRLAAAARRPAAGEPVPAPRATISFFQAGGAEAEVEEVFRRILASGRPLDHVEIACARGPANPAALIWEKTLRYGWPVTLSGGIPATLTRPGRALLGLTEWIEDQFSAGLLRRLLQSGDLTLGDSPLSAGRAARLLVRAEAAWGRDTYRLALGRLAASVRQRAARDDIPEDEAERLRVRAVEADALAAWIAGLITAVPTPGADGRVGLSDLTTWAQRVVTTAAARTSALDHAAATRLGLAIGELAALGAFRCPMGQALRFIRERVEGLSVGADRPRPGHLHVSSLAEAGLSGRPLFFAVGLEEGRVFPSAFEDPILLDAERARVDASLRQSADVADEAVHAVIGRLTSVAAAPDAAICLSYSCRDLRQFRESHASWVMLHMFRLATGDRTMSYRDLHQHLGAPVSSVPASGTEALGPGRWWLRAVVAAGETAGRAGVLQQFPSLAAGVRADEARSSTVFTEYDGYVPEAGRVLDPCAPDVVVSPTQLEEAAECAFRYFLRRGLKIDAIDTGARDRDLWLNPLIRGSLLHDLYARLLRRCREAKRRPALAADRDWLQARGQETLAALGVEMPAPSVEVGERESREFLADLELFLAAEVEAGAARTPVALEVGFGRARGEPDEEPLSLSEPVTIRAGGLTFRVAGRVDRIDQLADGSFEVLDYKTGRFWPDRWRGTFAGGRRLQHALYGLAALELLKRHTAKPKLAGAQYYFTSAKGRLERKVIPEQPVTTVGRVLSDLRDVITSGIFVHAADEADCRFCDYSAACSAAAHTQAKAKRGDPRLSPCQRLAAHA
jgi:ATP-dependent helicase/nuclease subunit B